MTTIFQKLRTIGLSKFHSLLDKVIDLDSVGAVKQHVRDLEHALADLESGAAEAAGYVRTLTREKTELEERAKRLDRTIDVILDDKDPTNDHVATAKQVELDGINERLAQTIKDLDESMATARKLDEAVSALRSKHAAMVRQIQQLESLDRSNCAKKDAAKAIGRVQEMVSAGEGVSVDSVIARMEHEGDVADEKFDRAMGAMHDASSRDVAIAEAQTKIAERRKRLQRGQPITTHSAS